MVKTLLYEHSKIEAAINLIRGQIHEALGCSDAAIDCYKLALNGDVYCYEALNSLSSNQMLTPKDGKWSRNFTHKPNIFLTLIFIYTENQLIQNLPIESQCNTKEGELVKYVYATKMSRVKSLS